MIYYTKVTHPELRKMLAKLALESDLKRDIPNLTNVVDHPTYQYFVTNDAEGLGCGFATTSCHGQEISLDEMVSKLAPIFTPVKVVLNREYTAEIQQDGTVKVGCQIFTHEAIRNLLIQMNNVIDKR